MINLTRFTFVLCSLFLTTAMAYADDTSGSGKGFSTVKETTKIEGKSGFIVHNTVEDFWHYEKAPKGWPMAVMATCHQTLLFKAGSKAPISIEMVCESIDKDGDASIWRGVVDPKTFVGKGKLVAGTGKYANIEVNPTFQTVYEVDTGHSIYTFKW